MISGVKVFPFKKVKGPVLAFASVEFMKKFVVTGIKVIENRDGELFIAMPSREDENTDSGYRDVAFPITAEFREELQEAIIAQYEETMAEENSGRGKSKDKDKDTGKGKDRDSGKGNGKGGRNTR